MNDPLLFTPGPLTTSATVKAAMQRDLGSRDTEFINLVAEIRRELLQIAGVSQEGGYETVLMQGSGTFAIESVLSSVIPPDGRLLILANGAYGERMVQIAERLKIAFRVQRWPENESPDPATVAQLLARNTSDACCDCPSRNDHRHSESARRDRADRARTWLPFHHRCDEQFWRRAPRSPRLATRLPHLVG